MADVAITVEMEFSGIGNGWTDVTEDVLLGEPVSWSRGIAGQGQMDRTAMTGALSLTLDNSEANSVGLRGYYTPGHADCREGFARGIGVRLKLWVAAEGFAHFTGTIHKVMALPGEWGQRRTMVECVDYMDQLARKRLTGLATLVDAPDEEVFEGIIEKMQVQPRALEVDEGFDDLPYVFDNMRDERAVPMAEIQKLCQSTLALVYVKGDGTLVYESRRRRALINNENVIEIGPGDLPPGQPAVDDSQSDLVNRVQVVIHPRRLDTEEVILYRINAPILVQPGLPYAIRGLYTDPAQRARRAGGMDMVAAEPYTDYELNSEEGGGGTDLTGKLDVTTDFSANSVLFTVEHDHSQAAWLTKLQARGTGVHDQERIAIETEDEGSIEVEGEYPLSIDMPYQHDAAFGWEVAQFVLSLHSQGFKQVRRVEVILNGMTDERARAFAIREISDRFGITEPMTGLDGGGYHINGIAGSAANGIVSLAFVPIIADLTQYWYLGVTGASELDETTRLGFGLVVGHADVAHCDTHSDEAHTDSPHADQHTDTHEDAPHGDSAHTDSHSDTAHVDTAHVDSHADVSHSDTPHTDSHSDVTHVDSHSDTAHQDTHEDVPHEDWHEDHNDYI